MQGLKQFDVTLAKFKNYLLWPVKIMQIGKNLRRKPTYLVFCNGNQDEFRLIVMSLQEYNPKKTDSSAPIVKKAFVELLTHRLAQIGIDGILYWVNLV